jgi:small subunit ribosomal protein S18
VRAPRRPASVATPKQKDFHTVAKQRKSATKPSRRRDKKGGPGSGRRKPCPYCKDKIEQVDYKDVTGLRRFVSERGKIRSRRITGACRRHQSQIANAVKRARELALLPYAAEPASESVGRGGRSRDRERD